MRISKRQLRRVIREELVTRSIQQNYLNEKMQWGKIFSKIAVKAGPAIKKAGPALKKGGKAAIKFAQENPEFVEMAAAPILQKAQEKMPVLKDMGLTDVASIQKALKNPDKAEIIAQVLSQAGPKLEDAAETAVGGEEGEAEEMSIAELEAEEQATKSAQTENFMRITERRLRRIIKEEIQLLNEEGYDYYRDAYRHDAVGGGTS
jgi:hypothetical protein